MRLTTYFPALNFLRIMGSWLRLAEAEKIQHKLNRDYKLTGRATRT